MATSTQVRRLLLVRRRFALVMKTPRADCRPFSASSADKGQAWDRQTVLLEELGAGPADRLALVSMCDTECTVCATHRWAADQAVANYMLKGLVTVRSAGRGFRPDFADMLPCRSCSCLRCGCLKGDFAGVAAAANMSMSSLTVLATVMLAGALSI